MKVGSVVSYFGEQYVVTELEYLFGRLVGVWCVSADNQSAKEVFLNVCDLD